MTILNQITIWPSI